MVHQIAKQPERVIVLLHGFAAHWLLMTRLEKHCRVAGHRTLNWGYSSWFRPIEYHAERLQKTLRQLDEDASIQTIDLVTHSMGCIVTRAALQAERPSKLGRWVMLAPPNRGSAVANAFPTRVKRILKPIDQLQAKEDSFVNRLPAPQGIDFAIIQARGDYIVDQSSTLLPNYKAKLAFPGLHSQLLFRQDVGQQTLHFLHHGEFAPSLA